MTGNLWEVDLAGYHSLHLMECRWPESVDGGYDIILPFLCKRHFRSINWCLDSDVLWCDGPYGGGLWWPHSLVLALSPGSETQVVIEMKTEYGPFTKEQLGG